MDWGIGLGAVAVGTGCSLLGAAATRGSASRLFLRGLGKKMAKRAIKREKKTIHK
jgi:hypothetical protein